MGRQRLWYGAMLAAAALLASAAGVVLVGGWGLSSPDGSTVSGAPRSLTSASSLAGGSGLSYEPAVARTPAPTPVAMPPSFVVPTVTPTPEPNRYIWIPWRSQLDGSPYASSNCGPASLGMAMSYYGEWWSTRSIRASTNDYSGVSGYDDGTDWPSLKHAAETRGFKVIGLFNSAGGYREWTIDDLVGETDQGHPVLLLVRYRSLPGHEFSTYGGDHYIVFLGLMADGRVVYHDPAFYEEIDGSYRITSQETLMDAWAHTSAGLRCTAMSVVWEHQGRKWDDPNAAEPAS